MKPVDNQGAERPTHAFSEEESRILNQLGITGESRRKFLTTLSAAGLSLLATPAFATGREELPAPSLPDRNPAAVLNEVKVNFTVNGKEETLRLDSRTTLLDALREHLELTGTKKGCNLGQCGACTVLIDGRRKLSCLTLAASCQEREVKTVEGLAEGNDLHPVQAAFVKQDGYQCGYCTPGQVCSSVALLEEARRGEVSYVTENIKSDTSQVPLSEEEIRERMSGNICRCGTYNNIVRAIQESQTGEEPATPWTFATQEQVAAAKKS